MQIASKKLSKRIINAGFAFVLALSTVTASLPYIAAGGNAAAAPAVVTTHSGFNSLTNWVDDRSAPSGGFSLTNTTLNLNVDGDYVPAPTLSSAFYRTEGRKADLPAGTNSIKATLHVDADWQDVIGVRAGIWGVTTDTSPYYPILEFSNRNDSNDQLAGTPVIRAYNTVTGAWVNVVDNPVYGSDYTFEIVHNPATSTIDYFVNGSNTPAYTASSAVNPLGQVIFNNYNSRIAGNDYTVVWTNFAAGKRQAEAPGNVRFVYGSSTLASGSYVATTDVKLMWDTISVPSRYRVTATHPDGSTTNFQPSTSVSWNPASMQWNLSDAVRNGLFGAEIGDKGEGEYRYTVAVKVGDIWSLESAPITLVYDKTAPAVAITSPSTNGAVVKNTTNVVVTGTDNIELKRVTAHLYDSNGNQVPSVWQHPFVNGTSHTLTIPLTGLADGAYQLKAAATDENDKSVYATRDFTIDTTPPNVPQLLSPGNGTPVNGSNPLANDWTDETGAVHYVYQSFNVLGGVCNLSDIRWEQIYNDSETNSRVLANGLSYCWRVKAVDAAGNESNWSSLWKTTVDNVAPVASILNPIHGSLVRGNVTLEGQVTDVNPLNSYFLIEGPSGYIQDSLFTDGRSLHTYAWNTVSLEDGIYTIYFEARDKAQNKDGSRSSLGASVDKVIVTVDNTVPVVALINYATTANVITPSITVDDASLPLTYAWAAADTNAAANVGITGASTLTPAFTVNVDGTYGFNLVVTDAAGNTTTQLFTFTYTTPAPEQEDGGNDNNGGGAGGNTGGGFTAVALNDGIVEEGEGEAVLGEETTSLAALSGASEDQDQGQVAGASDTKEDGCGVFLGICWYYWVPIVLAVLVAVYGIRRKIQSANS